VDSVSEVGFGVISVVVICRPQPIEVKSGFGN
jgi:hypothetical protein